MVEDGCRAPARSRARLASRASSARARRRPRSPRGCATWAEVEELPVADGGEGTAEVLYAARGGRWHEVTVQDAFGRPRLARVARAAGRDGSRRGGGGDSARPGAARPARGVEPGLRRADLPPAARPCAVRLPGRHGDGRRRGGACARCSSGCPRRPGRVRRRRARSATPRACSGRRRAPTPAQVELLEARLLALPELRPYADLPGAGAAGGLGAALAALGAELVPGAELVLDAIGIRSARGRPRRHRGGDGRRARPRREGPCGRRAPVPRGGRSLRRLRRPRRRAAARGGDGRASRATRRARREDLVRSATAWRSRRGGLAPRSCRGPRRASRGRSGRAPRRAARA